MKKLYLSSTKNNVVSLKSSKAIRLLLMVLIVLLYGNNMIAQSGPNCPTVCAGPGGSFSGNLIVIQNTFYSSIIIKNKETLIVRSGFTLYVGQFGTPADTRVVDFQNGCIVLIEPGASLVVNGLLNNSNNSNGVTFNGSVAVTGNITAGNASTIVGSGTLETTGSIETDNAGSIFNTTTDCINGPCYGSSSCALGAIKTWKDGQWVPAGAPNANQKIVFAGQYPAIALPLDPDITACSCQVNANVTVNINKGSTLTLTNELKVLGAILFKNKSSLVQINNVANTGVIAYERNIDFKNILETDYTYWSSPVVNFKLGSVYSPNLNGLFYSYFSDATREDWQRQSSTDEMTPGKGYIINGAKSASAPSPPPSAPNFKGVPNNGPYSVSVFKDKSCLLGNPYPSAIDADKFLAANAGVLDGTLYFWTHNTPIGIGVSNPGTGVYAYSSDDYASYNFTGGVGIAVGNLPGGIVLNEITAKRPSGKIVSGQGFFATGKTSGSVTFRNDMRLSSSGAILDNSQFFKTKNPNGKTANTIEKNRVWLNLTNTQGAFKQTLIGYVRDATNEYDSRFDGQSFDGNEFVDFYSVNQDLNLVIQGRALPFQETDEVPLGYRTTIDGDFTINIDQVDGLLTNQTVFIEDKLTNIVFNLRTGNYTFSTVPGIFNDRFVLRYKDNSTANPLATTNFDTEANKVLVSNKNKQITINSFAETIDKVAIYDMLGKQIYQKDKVNSNELSIANLVSSHQTLVVKTSLQNGRIVTDKIIF